MTGPDADVADGFYSPRELTYIQPAGRRLSDYEASICHVQPDVNHYDFGGWLLLAPDGKSLFEASSTRLRHPDWFQYRDPSSLWQRTYMRQQAVEERAVASLLESARSYGYFADLDGFWAREILARYHQGYGFLEWGLFLALNRAVRLALSDTLTMMITFTAVDRLRHQQAIALFGLELEQELGGIPDGLGRSAWVSDPVYQPARRVVERLMAAEDWCEIVVVCGLLIDPLLSTLAGRHFFRRFASVNGDAVTPAIAITAEPRRDGHLRHGPGRRGGPGRRQPGDPPGLDRPVGSAGPGRRRCLPPRLRSAHHASRRGRGGPRRRRRRVHNGVGTVRSRAEAVNGDG